MQNSSPVAAIELTDQIDLPQTRPKRARDKPAD